jgi:hypothetical protein
MLWDCFCAICGRPFTKCQYLTKARTKGGVKSNAAGARKRETGSNSVEEDSDDTDDSDYGFGSKFYDEEVITAEEAGWTTETIFLQIIHVLLR